MRQAGQARADVLFVPSSDWKIIAEMHTHMHVFRAIENGVTLVRPTRQGLSIAVDTMGRVLGQADTFATDKPVMVVSVPTEERNRLAREIHDGLALPDGHGDANSGGRRPCWTRPRQRPRLRPRSMRWVRPKPCCKKR